MRKQIREKMKSILKLQIMIQYKYLHYSAAFFLLIGSFSWSQFIEVNAELDLRRLSEGDRQLFTTLAEDIDSRKTELQSLRNEIKDIEERLHLKNREAIMQIFVLNHNL